jgi:membrane-associated phospholipid phosphatase
MNALDGTLLRAAARASGASPDFDLLISFISANHLFKGFVVMAAIWWIWFRDPAQPNVREQVMVTLLAGLIALFVARLLAHELPFRVRPFVLPDFANAFPLTRQRMGGLEEWSSFPSDHATLFAALATGAWFAWRRLGLMLWAYALVVIFVPRVYLGMHYPTDILAGALIGIAIAWALHVSTIRSTVAKPFLQWQVRSPGSFYACAYLLTAQIAVLFDPVRHVARFAAELAGAH